MFDTNYYGTQGGLSEENKEPLPDLCHKCGRCCKSATTYHNHEKLTALAEGGDQEAIDFLEIFEPYDSLEDARQVVPDQVEQVMHVIAHRDDMDENNVTFYHCRYVTPEGLCGIYERRPRCCREAPGHGWSVMPPGCGFEGWQFEQREKQKRMIRDLKTSLYLMEQMSPDGVHHPIRPETTLDELRLAVDDRIKPWVSFGAGYW
ncbi:MAG: YkgJ family cysteine cluster protein [Vampirovibrionales bacterium]|nr:YkgJ family cysteine cluster protein [Vampirovibrionales bacterium]